MNSIIENTKTSISELEKEVIGFVIDKYNRIDSLITEFSDCGEYFTAIKITSFLGVQVAHSFPCESPFYRVVSLGMTLAEFKNDPFKFMLFLKDNKIESYE